MDINHRHFDTARLNAVPVSEIARWLGMTLHRKGSLYFTCCPFHEDKTPSMALYERNDENRFHCFVCSEGWSVIDFVMKHQEVDFKEACRMIGTQFGIDANDNVSVIHKPLKILKREHKSPSISYVPEGYMHSTVTCKDSMCQCLSALYDRQEVVSVAKEYMLGTYDNGNIRHGTIFWSIDIEGRVRNGKVQCYCSDVLSNDFAHFDKSPGKVLWIGKQLSANGVLPAEATLDNNCLYGEHLLAKYPDCALVLVESPKNAIVGALEMPQFVWLATGNKGMLKEEVLKVLKGRDVIVIPDRDAIGEWAEKIGRMKHIANFTVSDFCEKNAPEGHEKYDIADWIIAKRLQNMAL